MTAATSLVTSSSSWNSPKTDPAKPSRKSSRVSGWLCLLAFCLAPGESLAGEYPAEESGSFRYVSKTPETELPEIYRLGEKEYPFKIKLKERKEGVGIAIHEVTFPSPFESPHPENNTVWAEYYRPLSEAKEIKKAPGVVVLDITGGDQSLSRMICTQLARQGINALFVQMAYYGPRRPKGTKLKLLSTDILQTVKAVQQTVQDLRVAAAFLESRPEVDPQRIGITGTSLGSFFAALGAEMESRYSRCSVLLGGGGFIDGFYDHPEAGMFRLVWEGLGNDKAKAARMIAPYDPITLASRLKTKKVLIMAAAKDEIVSPKMAKALWEQTGKQKILWFDTGHYSAIIHLPQAIEEIAKLMKE